MVNIESRIVKTDVTCVKCFQNYIIAGIGSNLHVFTRNGKLHQMYNVLQGQKIHGIIPNSSNKIAVFGANVLKILEFEFIKSEITKILISRQCNDWIFSVQWIESDTQLATIFAHNYISLWSASDLKLLKNVGCDQKCTLYSATLINNTWNNLFVLSGTVFGQILIWKPADYPFFAPVICSLEGHDGAIFSISYDKQLKTIVSTSDDRTVRLWSFDEDIFTEEYYKTEFKINLKHTMYGHVARIFKCKIIKNYIITAGEDSFVHIWNLDGKLIRKFETHQGGCVWALDIFPEEIIVTGGGDSGVSLYPLRLKDHVAVLDAVENETPKSLKLTAQNNIVVVMDSGWVKYYEREKGLWVDVDLHLDLRSYAVLEVSAERDLIAIAGLQGSIHIYKEENNQIIKQCSRENCDGIRIFSLHWLSPNTFLTSTTEGIMHIWNLVKIEANYQLQIDNKFILPPCKERWATCAVACFDKYFAVGDRKGHIHLYVSENEEAIQTVKKAHCHLGVTSLFSTDNQLFSLGRNAILNKYNLTNNLLTKITNDKLPFSWLAVMKKQNNTNLLLGFSGSNFIIYNLDHRRIILEINCGGGHRSWDSLVTANNLLYFYFIKEKRLNVYSEKWKNILTVDLITGYHTKEINCAASIKLLESGNHFLIISGGEDTTIRLSTANLDKQIPQFSSVYTLKSHLSSVRCITYFPLSKNEYLIFSGGGRSQIILQKLKINYLNNTLHNVDCHELHSYHKPVNDDEVETRIMDLDVVNLTKTVLVIAACSDGTLKFFKVDLNDTNMKLQFLCDIVYASKCIIRLAFINISNRYVAISMATDGKLAFWDFTDFCTKIDVTNVCVKSESLKPFYVLQAHQSGINSYCFYKLNDERYIFATGGDDNSIVLNVVDILLTNDSVAANLVCKWSNSKTHGAQVTGVFINSRYCVTTSIDQHISVFKYNLDGKELKCELLKQYCSAVSDIQGMQCIELKDQLYAFIYGKGIEICNLNEFR